MSAKETSIGSDDFHLDDKPTIFSHPMVKITINALAFIVLGKNFKNLDGNFFTSLLMFCCPIFIDWLSFSPRTVVRKRIRAFGLAVVGIVSAISILGLMGIFIVINPSGSPHIMIAESYFIASGVSFPALVVMILLLVSLIINFVYWFCVPSKAEEKTFVEAAATSVNRK